MAETWSPKPGVLGWDFFGHAEGQFSPNVKSPKKVSKWVPRASRPRGARKSEKSLKRVQN